MIPPEFPNLRAQSSSRLRVETDLPLTPLSSNASDVRSRDDQDATRLQETWDKSIAEHMDLPNGYHNVHILTIQWKNEIDQLHVKEEVDELTTVFKDIFNYDVTRVELGAEKSEQQLDKEISDWIYKYDNSNNLLILYYAGHGIFNDKTKVLEFTPTNEAEDGPRVIWNRVESRLQLSVDADVLAIMDCCYASDMLRNVPEFGRTYEMLCASHIGLTTAQPGARSFTRCLIKHLKELAAELPHSFFTTFDILERMQKDRPDEPPALWRRIPGSHRHIRLSKLKPSAERPKGNKEIPSHERFLHLGFALKNESFNEVHIERLTKKLPALFSEVGVPLLDIRWLGCRKTGQLRFDELAQFVLKHRKDFIAISPAMTERKRTADESGMDESSEDGAPFQNTHKQLRLHEF
ncbi:hypothetical protein BCR34DRAFT_578572 [Clohesyomyces aquaticus]|uniref:Peptidase C14 caspase domain-containing protein n=1 Tax=Clohesyomyces aquaticus TaxID=1231657 RepID=A0A1Y1YF57_9PLEO|nr:hypothetical protein BCR34DRAFT_578572 [Clohesyomyces aquaticus]